MHITCRPSPFKCVHMKEFQLCNNIAIAASSYQVSGALLYMFITLAWLTNWSYNQVFAPFLLLPAAALRLLYTTINSNHTSGSHIMHTKVYPMYMSKHTPLYELWQSLLLLLLHSYRITYWLTENSIYTKNCYKIITANQEHGSVWASRVVRMCSK